MTDKAIIAGVYSDLKPVKTRGVLQIVVEVPMERADEVTRAFGWPQPGESQWLAVAAMGSEPDKPQAKPAREKREWDELSNSEQAGIRCNDEQFQRFVHERVHKLSALNADSCARAVRWYCNVDSRSKLNHQPAAFKWDELDKSYRRWAKEQTA